MTSLDDTWTISDLSSSHGGSLRNSINSTDTNNIKKRQIQKPIYSPISSIDSQSDTEEFQKPIKPFLKKTSGGYTAANPIQSNATSNEPKKSDISNIPTNIIPLPSHPKVKFEQDNDLNTKETNDIVPIVGPDLFSLAKSGVQNLAISQNLRGYEIAPPKVTTHMDFMEYMKFNSKKREYGMVTDIPKSKKVEEEKKDLKIPEALYTYFAKSSPQKKEIEVNVQKKETQNIPKFPKHENFQKKPKKETKDTSKVYGRRLDINFDLKKGTEINRPEESRIEIENKKSEKNIEQISSFKNDIENIVKESEQKLSSFQKMLEKLLQQKEKEYDNILVKSANQVTNTMSNSMARMGLDLRIFYKQFDKLQKVTAEITSKFGKQLSEDQKRSQTLMIKQMKQIEDLGKKLETIEKKTNQLRTDSKKEIKTFPVATKNHRQKKTFFDLISKTAELTIDDIHNEVSKKHPSIFKYPSWEDHSSIENLDFYQNEQKYLIEELVGKSIDFSMSLDFSSILIEQPNFSISIDEKVKIDNLPPKPLVLPKTELSSDDILKLFPGFSENLLKFSIMNNKNIVKTRSVPIQPTTLDIIPEKQDIVTMEAHSVQTDRPKDVSLREAEIQTELDTSVDNINTKIDSPQISEEKIENCNIGWEKKDKSAIYFQNGIDSMVEKELSKFEKEGLLRELLPKKNTHQIPKLNECEDFDGICFTSHYSNRLIKTDDIIQSHMPSYVKGKKDLDLIFEEYANCLIERVIKHISMNIIGEYINEMLHQRDSGEEIHLSNGDKYISIKGGALCADLFTFCYNNDISCDDEIVYKVTEELLIYYIKSKLPTFETPNRVSEHIEQNCDDFDLERIYELVAKLLLNDIMRKRDDDDCNEIEYISNKVNVLKDKEIEIPKEKVVIPFIPAVETGENRTSFGTSETQTEQTEYTDKVSSVPAEPQSKLGLPHSTFFILSDNLLDAATAPISVTTETKPRQYTIHTQTTLKLESSSVQTNEFSKSMSAVQTEAPITTSSTTETVAKNLFVQCNPSSFFNIAPQTMSPKTTQSQNIQTSFSNLVNTKKSFSSEGSYSNTSSSYESSIESQNNLPVIGKPQYEEEDLRLKKEKVFATLDENDIERMLKIEMLKRSITGKEKKIQTLSEDSGTEDSFLSSDQSMSTFYTSDSSNGFSYSNKNYEEIEDYFDSSSSHFSETLPFDSTVSLSGNYSTLGRYSIGESSQD